MIVCGRAGMATKQEEQMEWYNAELEDETREKELVEREDEARMKKSNESKYQDRNRLCCDCLVWSVCHVARAFTVIKWAL